MLYGIAGMVDNHIARFNTGQNLCSQAVTLADFDFTDTPVNEPLVRELGAGGFLANQRNAVLIGGTGTGKSHLAVAIARACIRDGARARFFNVVDLVNRLEAEARVGRQGRLADQLARRDLVILDAVDAAPLRPGILLASRDDSSRKLLNVSLSRARGKLILVADAAYFESRARGSAMQEALQAALASGHHAKP